MIKNALRLCSCGGILAGIYIIRNQGRYVIRRRLLDALRKTVLLVRKPSGTEARGLVMVTGGLSTTTPCVDPDFNMQNLSNLCRLSRKVEMYQWQEIKDREGKCSYQKIWSSHRINNDHFHSPGFENPRLLVKSREFSANDFWVGGFQLNHTLCSQIRFWADMDMPQVRFGGKLWRQCRDGWYYSSSDRNQLVGDLRVRFSAVFSNLPLTVLASQFGLVLKPFVFDPCIYERLAESGSAVVGRCIPSSIVDLIVVFVCGINSHHGKTKMKLSFVSKNEMSLQAVFKQIQSKETAWRRLEFGTALVLISVCSTFLLFDLKRSIAKYYNA